MKGSIYCIRSHQTDQIYIGSTTQTLCQRMTDHRKHYKKWLNQKYNYVTSFELLKFSDSYIELLQEVEVESKQELHKIEGENIRNHNCVNKLIAGRTAQEWYQENKVQILEQRATHYQENKVQLTKQHAKYRQENKVKINEKQKQKFTCKCDSIFTLSNKIQHCRTKKHLKYMSTLNGTDTGPAMDNILVML